MRRTVRPMRMRARASPLIRPVSCRPRTDAGTCPCARAPSYTGRRARARHGKRTNERRDRRKSYFSPNYRGRFANPNQNSNPRGDKAQSTEYTEPSMENTKTHIKIYHSGDCGREARHARRLPRASLPTFLLGAIYIRRSLVHAVISIFRSDQIGGCRAYRLSSTCRLSPDAPLLIPHLTLTNPSPDTLNVLKAEAEAATRPVDPTF